MRQGQNALNVIDGVKARFREIASSLPPGVEIESAYDRSGLIHDSINTLQRALIEEAVIVSLVILVFLFHFRSALIVVVTLPIAVLVSFIPIYFLGITSNIMSLGGLALAIGVLVDAAIVMVENGYRHLSERQANGAGPVSNSERRRILIHAARQVGPALFFSLLIILASFLPVLLLEAQEGRMFRPLVWTKSLAVGSASLLAITLVPALMLLLIRGKLRPERANPVSQITQALYLPVLRFCLRHRFITIGLNLLFLAVTLPIAFKLGSQFMPPLYEGSTLYMPTSLPGISVQQARTLLIKQDQILRTFPEVESVFGTVGRSESATDNAPSTCSTPPSCSSRASSGAPASPTTNSFKRWMPSSSSPASPTPGQAPWKAASTWSSPASRPARHQGPGAEYRWHRTPRRPDSEPARDHAPAALHLRRAHLPGLLCQC